MPDEEVTRRLMETHVKDCERRWADQEKRTRALEDGQTRVEMRLDTGQKSFQGLREQNQQLHETIGSLRPMPPSVPKIVTIVFLGLGVAGTIFAWIYSEFSARPTVERIEEKMNDHETGGHKETNERIDKILVEQGKQQQGLIDLKEEQKDQSGKLDELLERTPERRRRGRGR